MTYFDGPPHRDDENDVEIVAAAVSDAARMAPFPVESDRRVARAILAALRVSRTSRDGLP